MRVIFTDLDGTLLDARSYSYAPAIRGLIAVQRCGAALVFSSSKPRAEIEAWRKQLGNRDPFIAENGGALFVPDKYFPFDLPESQPRPGYRVIELGEPYAALVGALHAASAETGIPVRGFHQMTVAEVQQITGLPPDHAALAKQREYDEPFQLVDPRPGDEQRLIQAITRLGRRHTQGRFHHILGNNSKADCVRKLIDFYRRAYGDVRTLGLGDGRNDLEMLQAVDDPVIIQTPAAEELRALVPNAQITTQPGPAGWAEAVTAWLG